MICFNDNNSTVLHIEIGSTVSYWSILFTTRQEQAGSEPSLHCPGCVRRRSKPAVGADAGASVCDRRRRVAGAPCAPLLRHGRHCRRAPSAPLWRYSAT